MAWLRRLWSALAGLFAPAPELPAAPAAAPAPAASQPAGIKISPGALTAMPGPKTVPLEEVFRRARPAPGVLPKGQSSLAMDSALDQLMQFAIGDAYHEGIAFMGYAALAQMTVRQEYRRPAEIMAKEMTRKWIKFQATGEDDKSDRIRAIKAEFERLQAQDVFRRALEQDGWFGRSQIFIDTGHSEPAELGTPLSAHPEKITKGTIKRLAVIEPIWTYPNNYDSINPLSPNFYRPDSWFMQGQNIHSSRLMTIVGRPVPDILKPAYQFGGLSLSQMCKPYVDNWLRTRQSVSDLLHSFTVFVLSTQMGSVLNAGAAQGLFDRVDLFNRMRDNRGAMVVDKDTETLTNVSAPISGLDHLQSQSQEHMCLPQGTMIETKRGQIPIESVTTDDCVMTRNGYAPVAWAGVTKYISELIEIETDASTIRSTLEHPVWSETINGFVNAQNVDHSHRLLKSRAWGFTDSLLHGAAGCGAQLKPAIFETLKAAVCCIALSTNRMLGQSLMALTSIMRTATQATTTSAICWPSPEKSISLSINREVFSPALVNSTVSSAPYAEVHSLRRGLIWRFIAAANANSARKEGAKRLIRSALRAARNGSADTTARADPARVRSVRRIELKEKEPVYDITVARGHLPEFFANGVLVHNSAATGIPLVKLLGITPSGLNTSTDGEMESFYGWLEAEQNAVMRPHLERLLTIVQLSLFGDIDDGIKIAFEPMWTMKATDVATLQKTRMETDAVAIDKGIIDPAEARQRLATEEDSPYQGIDPDDVPEPPQEPGGEGGEGGLGGLPGPGGGEGDDDGQPGRPGAEPGAEASQPAAHPAPSAPPKPELPIAKPPQGE